MFYFILESLIIMDEQQIMLVSTCREGVGGIISILLPKEIVSSKACLKI